MKDIFNRANQYLLFLILLVVLLYYGRTLLIPLVFAALMAMLLAPVCRALDRRGFGRAWSAVTGVFILFAVLALIAGVVMAQFASFAENFAVAEQKAMGLLQNVQGYIKDTFNISEEKQLAAAKENLKGMGQSGFSMLTGLVGGLTAALTGILLTLVYTFLFLYNKEKYETFFLKVYKRQDPAKVKEVIRQITHVSQQYLVGRAISVVILFVAYAAGLLIIGIENALLLAAIAALLTIIPYVGTILGAILPIIMALVTKDSYQPAVWTAVVMVAIQVIDNYFVEPYVVGGEVRIDAFTTIFGLIAGGLLWGIAGMIIIIPVMGIAKIIFDNLENLKPYGYLIGDPDDSASDKLKNWFNGKFGRKRLRK